WRAGASGGPPAAAETWGLGVGVGQKGRPGAAVGRGARPETGGGPAALGGARGAGGCPRHGLDAVARSALGELTAREPRGRGPAGGGLDRVARTGAQDAATGHVGWQRTRGGRGGPALPPGPRPPRPVTRAPGRSPP